MSQISSKSGWEGRKSKGEINSVVFSDIFHKYLTPVENKTCLEIGCVPGSFLAYICKTFQYSAEGVDYVKDTKAIVNKTLSANGIKTSTIHEANFLEWNNNKKYDLVCSFGFVEHFSGKTNKEVIRKHIDLLKKGGKLIITVPNFRYLRYLILFILDKKRLKEHNLTTMSLSYYKKISKEYNLKVLHLDYSGRLFKVWGLSNLSNNFQKMFFNILKFIGKKVKTKIKTRFLSPYIVFIAEKV